MVRLLTLAMCVAVLPALAQCYPCADVGCDFCRTQRMYAVCRRYCLETCRLWPKTSSEELEAVEFTVSDEEDESASASIESILGDLVPESDRRVGRKSTYRGEHAELDSLLHGATAGTGGGSGAGGGLELPPLIDERHVERLVNSPEWAALPDEIREAFLPLAQRPTTTPLPTLEPDLIKNLHRIKSKLDSEGQIKLDRIIRDQLGVDPSIYTTPLPTVTQVLWQPQVVYVDPQTGETIARKEVGGAAADGNSVSPLGQDDLGLLSPLFQSSQYANGAAVTTTTPASTTRYLPSLLDLIAEQANERSGPLFSTSTECPRRPNWEPCVSLDTATTRFQQCCEALPAGCMQLCNYRLNKPQLQLSVLTGQCGIGNVPSVLQCASAGHDARPCCAAKGVLDGGRDYCAPFCHPYSGLPTDGSAQYRHCFDRLDTIAYCFWATQHE